MTAIVVKIGGSLGADVGTVCADIAALTRAGRRIVLVHGGSADIAGLAGRLGVAQRRLVAPDGVASRYTDPAMLEVVTLALAGSVKPRLVTDLVAGGVAAVGLTGLDAGCVRARRKSVHRAVVEDRTVLIRDNHSGRIERVDATFLTGLLDLGLTPVLSPPVMAEDGRPVNANADRLAAMVAVAVRATALILLTDVPGVRRDPLDERTVLATCAVPADGAPAPWVAGGMALKLVAAREALLGGVARVVVADGRGERPIQRALDGAGTRVVVEPAEVPA